MKLRVKMALLVLSAGLVALGFGGCFFQWLGDFFGDTLLLRSID